MTRQQRIDKGLVWNVYHSDSPDVLMFEGTKTQCKKYLSLNNLNRAYKRGSVRLSQIIWEEKGDKKADPHEST